ncbi:MAG: AAA family ATPase [Deltaproteobacteria bacterium]|jgi:hypothetical protein|nr:AAA family ATPase [Deltaproteobacteria bacterium]
MPLINIVQTPIFSDIIHEYRFYVDKTEYLYHLINDQKAKILCRPWGFGKTLLVDTLEELFHGNQDLFANLWIAASDYKFVKHPVIRLNFGFPESITPTELNHRIFNDLQRIALSEALPINALNPDSPLEDLIVNLLKKYNPNLPDVSLEESDLGANLTKVVILIDDYDAPIIAAFNDTALATSLQQTLSEFYRSFHNLEKYCHFILLTGQTKLGYGEVGPNATNFLDISYLPKYSGICGFTTHELDNLIANRFDQIAPELIHKNQFQVGQTAADLKKLILLWYNGYYFDGYTVFDQKNQEKMVKVFNPYSILTFFERKAFDNYWIQAHQEDFLTDIIAQKPERFIGYDFSGYSKLTLLYVNNPPIGLFLFQTGFLTMKETSISHGQMSYNLKIPNLEISLSFRKALLKILFDIASVEDLQNTQKNVQKGLASQNQFDLEEIFALAVARLTFRPPRPGDFFYRVVFHLFIYCLGFDTDPDDPSEVNRLELVKKSFAATHYPLENDR